jgi:hypothetical protein
MKQKLTLLFVSAPTTYGPTKPGIVARELVIPTSVPNHGKSSISNSIFNLYLHSSMQYQDVK